MRVLLAAPPRPRRRLKWHSLVGLLLLWFAWISCHPLGLLASLFRTTSKAEVMSPPAPDMPGSTPAPGGQHDASPGRRHYAYVLAASNHKTGTFQLHCITRSFRRATGMPLVWRADHFTGDVLLAPLVHRPPQPPGRPQFVGVGHAILQSCYSRRQEPEPGIFKCPTPQFPCGPDGMPTLSLEGCMLSLPAVPAGGAPGVAHFYRNPWDVVTSAYWYHIQQPVPREEAWLNVAMDKTADTMVSEGVPLAPLQALGVLAPDKRGLPYAEVLRDLPEAQGVQLEFWHTLSELYTMARQYLIFKAVPGAVQIRFEDAQADLDAALQPLMREFYPQDGEAFSRAIKANLCDPKQWNEKQLGTSTHVTSAKRPPGDRERLQQVLWEQPPVRQHLCLLAAALGYDSPLPCADADAAAEHRREGGGTGAA